MENMTYTKTERADFEKLLRKEFPIIYRSLSGLETGMGWADIIYEASKKLEEIAKKTEGPKEQNKFLKTLFPYVDRFSDLFRSSRYTRFTADGKATPLRRLQEWLIENTPEPIANWYWLKFYSYFAPPEDERLFITQLKEKFGTGRLYTSTTSDEIDAAVREFERLSAITCETCGAPAKVRGSHAQYWLATLCDFHSEEADRKRDERNLAQR